MGTRLFGPKWHHELTRCEVLPFGNYDQLASMPASLPMGPLRQSFTFWNRPQWVLRPCGDVSLSYWEDGCRGVCVHSTDMHVCLCAPWRVIKPGAMWLNYQHSDSEVPICLTKQCSSGTLTLSLWKTFIAAQGNVPSFNCALAICV